MGEVEVGSIDEPTASTVGGLERAPSADPVERAAAMVRIHEELFGHAPGDPVAVGRYEVRSRLGQGAMGVVYRAHDPELSREVAVKVLWRAAEASDALDVLADLRREARALAGVEHENVLPCYDVGVIHDEDGRVIPYVVTELVEGRTLARWVAERARGRSEILDVFVRAARGLAAVHAVGFVHRDFKPSNVLIGDDGRVLVSDFGLARRVAAEQVQSGAASDTENAAYDETASNTSIAGTLAYMAPEQQRGKRCAPAADQFAFCAALYEALNAERPFGRGSWDEVLGRKLGGPPRWKGRPVPGWLQRVVARGLAPDPAARHESMDELVDALDRRRSRGGSVRTALAVTAVAGGGLMMAWGGLRSDPLPEPACSDKHVAREQWTAGRRHELRDVLTARVDTVVVEDLLEKIDTYVARWESAAVNACEQTEVGAARRATTFCLHEGLAELDALLDSLASRASAELVDDAGELVAGLPDPGRCAGVQSGRQLWPLHPDAFEEVAATREVLARVRILLRAGLVKDAAALMDEVDVERVSFAPLEAEVLHRKGNVALHLGDREQTQRLLSRAVEVGTASGNDFIVVAAANLLVYEAGVRRSQLDEALRWARHCEAALERIGGDDRERAVLLYSLGVSYARAGQWERALEHHEAALSIRERLFGPESTDCAVSHHGIGNVYAEQGRLEEALSHFRRALEIEEIVHGPNNPNLAETIDNVGIVLMFMGKLDEALEYNARAGRLFASNYPEGHPKRLSVRENKAIILENKGQMREAMQELEAVVAGRIEQLGPSDPAVAYTLTHQGRLALQLGRLGDAEDYFLRALSIRDAVDPRHPETAGTLVGLAMVRIEKGHPQSAIEPAERALENLGEDGDPHEIADAKFALAQALGALARDRDRMRRLAEEALDVYREIGSQNVGEVEAFLAKG